MLFKSIVGLVAQRVVKTKMTTEHYSPQILLGLGLVAGVAAVVMIAKAHKKSTEVLMPELDELDMTERYLDEKEEEENREIDTQERVGYTAPIYRELAFNAVKLYGPGVLVGAVSIALIAGSHGIQHRRIGTLAGALTIVQTGFMEYRRRIVAEHGVDADERAYMGGEGRTVVVLEEDPETGKITKRRRKENRVSDEMDPVIYGRKFDYTNKNWYKERQMNEYFVTMVQNHMNDKLNLQGVVFLNDAYLSLGFERTELGQIAGWALDDEGDGFVDFGIDKEINHRTEENVPWVLDFNVSGSVLAYV